MEITLAIKHIHPTLEFGPDFEVFDDNQGEGPYIKWYNTEITEPTPEELQIARTACQTEEEINIKIARLRVLNAQLGEWGAPNVLVGFERIDTIRTAKVSELNAEVLSIKLELEDAGNYDQTLVDSLLLTFFG